MESFRASAAAVRITFAIVLGVFLTVLAVKTPWAPFPDAIIWSAGLAGSGALWWVRRWPVAVAVFGAGCYVLSGNPWPMWVGLFVVGMGLSGWWIGLTITISAVTWAALNFLQQSTLGFNEIGAALAQAGAVAGAGIYLGTRRRLLETLQEEAARAEGERATREQQARLEERSRIAREMHDVVAHKITLVAVQAGALEVGPDASNPRVATSARLIRKTAGDALEELRAVLSVLRDPGVPIDSAFYDLERLVEEWRGVGVPVSVHDTAADLPFGVRRTVFRVVEEGMTNAHKHAPGAPVTVEIADDDEVVMVVVENGQAPGARGMDLPGARIGLVGLEERLSVAGGGLVVAPTPAGGWRLEARIPVNRDASDPEDV